MAGSRGGYRKGAGQDIASKDVPLMTSFLNQSPLPTVHHLSIIPSYCESMGGVHPPVRSNPPRSNCHPRAHQLTVKSLIREPVGDISYSNRNSVVAVNKSTESYKSTLKVTAFPYMLNPSSRLFLS